MEDAETNGQMRKIFIKILMTKIAEPASMKSKKPSMIGTRPEQRAQSGEQRTQRGIDDAGTV